MDRPRPVPAPTPLTEPRQKAKALNEETARAARETGAPTR